jgi:hypothetical protein
VAVLAANGVVTTVLAVYAVRIRVESSTIESVVRSAVTTLP